MAIELMAAAQGIDFRCQEMGITTAQLGAGTTLAYALIRTKVPFLSTDTYMAPLIKEVQQLIKTGAIKEAVEARCPSASSGHLAFSANGTAAHPTEKIPAPVG